MNSTLSDKIEACYKALGKDRTHFAQEVGIPESTIRNWKRFNNIPSAEALYKISQYFKIPMEYFLEGDSSSLSDQELSLILEIRMLSDEQKKIIRQIIKNLALENKTEQN